MPRHLVSSPEVQPIVADLVELFTITGSVNALQRALDAELAEDGSEGRIHSNRLHGLLGVDPGRSVNTQTLETVRLALDRLELGPNPEREDQVRSAVFSALSDVEVAGRSGHERVAAAAAQSGLPEAVVQLIGAPTTAIDMPATSASEATGRTEPDWSFQDDAYRACMRSLSSGPNRKVGLILPTGGGKTRVAMRIVLGVLNDSDRADSTVIWVTHRSRLHEQALSELGRALREDTEGLPDDAVELLKRRVRVVMISRLQATLDELGDNVDMVVVDEAHHAAAMSYEPIFDRVPLRGLFLTATPNRTDELPIRIDEIAYTVTYRELFRRGVIIEPTFEPSPIGRLDWTNEAHLRDLSDYLLQRAEDDFQKTLVVTTRTDHVEALYDALYKLLEERPEHPLQPDDIGFVHGSRTSTRQSPSAFLDASVASPQGIVVATSQMLGEGFDDPAINAVVITHPSASMIQLMQSAGRGLRWAPGKQEAFVVQVRDSEMAYHFEQRWLYQDISDLLRPQLSDIAYSDRLDLEKQVATLLDVHNVHAGAQRAVLERAAVAEPGSSFSVLLTGLPFGGTASAFSDDAAWSAVPFAAEDREVALQVFNEFSGRQNDVSNNQDFLRNYVQPDPSPDSLWTLLTDMLIAMNHAWKELNDETYFGASSRPFKSQIGTTWLTYVTFQHHPTVPPALDKFFLDAHNRSELLAEYAANSHEYSLAAKIPHPLAGSIGFLLNESETVALGLARAEVLELLKSTDPQSAHGAVETWRLSLANSELPGLVLHRMDAFLSTEAHHSHTLILTHSVPTSGK